MLQQKKMRGAVAVLGLLAGAAANAHDRPYYYPGGQWSDPQVRLGVDVIWGGYGYAPRPPPVVWHPSYYERDSYYDEGRGRGHWRGKGHRKHHHRRHRWSDSD